MSKIVNLAADKTDWKNEEGDDEGEGAFRPLTRDEAKKLREANPPLSPWAVLAGQFGAGIVVAGAAWWITGRQNAGWSAFYGALVVVVPGALLARGLASKVSLMNPVTAAAGFFVWEAVKIAASVGMLLAAPKWVPDLDWLAMLIGLMVSVNMYWLALLVRRKRKTQVKN